MSFSISEKTAYGLASLCVATYAKDSIKLDASGNEVPSSVAEAIKEIQGKLNRPFGRLGWQVPPDSSITLLRHHRKTAKEVRLGGFMVGTPEYVAIVFRGTAYSDEWIANISYAVPAVQNVRQLMGLVVLSAVPSLRRVKTLLKMCDLQEHDAETAAYIVYLLGMVKQVKTFLNQVIQDETTNPHLASRALYITGHSLGGAASIITRKRLLRSRQQQYAKNFASRMVTVTFGAPPLLRREEPYGAADPRVCNVIRPDDIVPCMSLDLLGVVALPSTPFHYGDHFLLRNTRAKKEICPYKIRRRAIFSRAAFQFFLGAFTLHAFRRVGKGHASGSYAKDMEAVAFK